MHYVIHLLYFDKITSHSHMAFVKSLATVSEYT